MRKQFLSQRAHHAHAPRPALASRQTKPSCSERRHRHRGRFFLLALVVLAAISLCFTMHSAKAAIGDVNVVVDKQLQACINETKLSRAADVPISATEIAGLTSSLTCNNSNGYAGITSFEGLQGANITGFYFGNGTISDLTPIGDLPKLVHFVVQSYTTPDGIIDLTKMTSAADTLTDLKFNVSLGTMPTKQILGLENFPKLTVFAVNSNALSQLPGLETLTNLQQLYLTNNYFDNSIIAQLPAINYALLNLSFNNIDNFTGVPTADSLFLAGQRVFGNEVILASADMDTYTIDPLSRPVAPAGKAIVGSDGQPDIGPFMFNTANIVSAAYIGTNGWNPATLPSGFDNFSYHAWKISPSSTSDSATSFTAYPTVIVDMADNSEIALPANTALDQKIVSFSYSSEGPNVPTFLPVSFALASGNLPTGVSVDPTTGNLVGQTAEGGTFNFEISATDANGLTVIGSFTATVLIVPDNSGSQDLIQIIPGVPSTGFCF